MTDYAAIDAAILETIRQGKSPLYAREVSELADALAEPDRWGSTYGSRVIDRRLQALRKAGKITHDRKNGWRLA